MLGVTDLSCPVDITDGPEYSGGVICCGDRVLAGVCCRERYLIQSDLDCRYVNYVSHDPVGMGCTVPADGCTGSFGTLLSGPLCHATDDMTYWEKLEDLGGDIYDYGEGFTVNPAPLITMTQGIMRSGVIGIM